MAVSHEYTAWFKKTFCVVDFISNIYLVSSGKSEIICHTQPNIKFYKYIYMLFHHIHIKCTRATHNRVVPSDRCCSV